MQGGGLSFQNTYRYTTSKDKESQFEEIYQCMKVKRVSGEMKEK